MGRTFRKKNSSSEQIFGVEKYWIHKKFEAETFDNDIGERGFLNCHQSSVSGNVLLTFNDLPSAALLKLKTDVGICAVNTPEVYPVCLPERGLVLPDWTECEISGYGKDTECKLPSNAV